MKKSKFKKKVKSKTIYTITFIIITINFLFFKKKLQIVFINSVILIN